MSPARTSHEEREPSPDDWGHSLASGPRGRPVQLAGRVPVKARLVELRHFDGLTGEAAAGILGISARTADRYWTYARAWLRREMDGAGPDEEIEKSPGAGDDLSSH